MSDAAANKALLEHAYRRWHETKGGCLEEIIAIFADDIHFGSIGDGRPLADFTASCVGPEQLRGYFRGLLDGWAMIHYTVDQIIAEGNRAAVVGQTAWRNKATGKIVDTPKVDVWEFRNGRAVAFFEYFDTAKLFAAATPN